MAHGGDIYTHSVDTDLSVNINPYPLPASVRKAMYEALLQEADHYPDPQCMALRSAISKALGVSEEMILCGDGASELLMAAVHAIRPAKALLLAPGYVGYDHALKAVECSVEYYPLHPENGFAVQEDFLDYMKPGIDLVTFANPNNPTGRMIGPELLAKILEKAEALGIFVMVDESYLMLRDPEIADPWPDLQKTLEEHPHLLLLRAFTKSFALPGIRIGYLLMGASYVSRAICTQLPEWNVSVIAQRAGTAAAAELALVKEQAALLQKEKSRLQGELARMGLEVYESEANYFLVKSDYDLYQALLEQRILIRSCDDFEGLSGNYFRIGVRTRTENDKMLCVLQKILSGQGDARSVGSLEEPGEYPCKDIRGTAESDISSCEDARRRAETRSGSIQIEHVLPADIEKNSFQTIARELMEQGRTLDPVQAPVTMRLIHTSADFEYADTLYYSPKAVETAWELIRQGADIVTDTNMALAGINKKELAKYGGQAHCFMALPETAQRARERGSTRATVCMEMAAELGKPVIFAIGNAPTALIELRRMADEGIYRPAFVIGMPVGFVNVVAAKELILETDIPCIINRGRKGGSNVAAATCNALLYSLRDLREKQKA